MPSLTIWTRLEPRSRNGDLRESLQAQVRDPFWLLTRQWQLGEFDGENAGSPVQADLTYEYTHIDRYMPRPDTTAIAYDYSATTVPLEAVVEEETRQNAQLTGRERAESGLELLRRLPAALRAAYEATFANPDLALTDPQKDMDAENRTFYSVLARRVPDGAKFRLLLPQDLAAPIDWAVRPPIPGVTTSDQAPLEAVLKEWATWYDTQLPAVRSSAWDPQRLEYRFDVSGSATKADGTTGALQLQATEYHGGHLDWWAFDADVSQTAALPNTKSISVRPTGIQYAGMPASRFWTFEATAVDFGGIETAPSDIAKLIFAEFALVYGNDFFLIPIELNIGTVTRVTQLQVTDTFGQLQRIAAASDLDRATAAQNKLPWRVFSLTSTGEQTGDLLFLAPALVGDLQGEPLEEVMFLRDEMANCAWAIENRVTGEGGRSYIPHEANQTERQSKLNEADALQPGITGPASGPLTYRLFMPAPEYWHPLLPRQVGGRDRRVLLKLRENGPIRGVLLSEHSGGAAPIYEEELPRRGLRLSREPQLARWQNGRTAAWIGRRKSPGPGQGDSGLRFDELTPDDER